MTQTFKIDSKYESLLTDEYVKRDAFRTEQFIIFHSSLLLRLHHQIHLHLNVQ